MFNGTNADDRRDPTRLGLVAAVTPTASLPVCWAEPSRLLVAGKLQRGQPSGRPHQGRSARGEPRAWAAQLEFRGLAVPALTTGAQCGGKPARWRPLRACANTARGGCDQATERHLAAVETAEEIVRRELSLTPEDNLRVRMVRCCPSPSPHPAPLTPRRLQLAGRRVAIEVDNRLVDQAT